MVLVVEADKSYSHPLCLPVGSQFPAQFILHTPPHVSHSHSISLRGDSGHFSVLEREVLSLVSAMLPFLKNIMCMIKSTKNLFPCIWLLPDPPPFLDFPHQNFPIGQLIIYTMYMYYIHSWLKAKRCIYRYQSFEASIHLNLYMQPQALNSTTNQVAEVDSPSPSREGSAVGCLECDRAAVLLWCRGRGRLAVVPKLTWALGRLLHSCSSCKSAYGC